jgi:cytoskeleton protein RodZ
MSSTPFGEQLKREREMRGVSLDEVSAATRINTRFLEAIENDRWNELPGGAFNRGFIRSIARFLGLDEDSMVAEYALGTSQTSNVREVASLGETGRNWRPVLVLAVIVILLLVTGLLVHHFYGSRIRAILHGWRSHAPSITAGSANLPYLPSAPPGQIAPLAGSTAAPFQQSNSAANASLTLRIQIQKPGYLKVVADGETVFRGRLRTGDSRDFQARKTLNITASRPSGVRLDLDGQNIPFPGRSGQLGHIMLTKDDLHPAEGGVH